MDTLRLKASIEALASLDFARSSGPGGQNVNKTNTKVVARIVLAEVEGLSEAERAQAATRLASRLTKEGEIVVHSDEERSQQANREAALGRLFALVLHAARLQKRRRPTRPGRAAREERLADKRGRSSIKRERGKRDFD